MSTKSRGVLAALAAGTMALTLVSGASAEPVDGDNPIIGVPESSPATAEIYRIADADRIKTAIKASKSAKWGDIEYRDWQRWNCDGNSARFLNIYDGRLTTQPAGTEVQVPAFDIETFTWVQITCTAEYAFTESAGNLDIIVARSDDYPDALAAAPLADVLDAPILLNPTGALNADVRAEIARLAGEAGGRSNVVVHLLGGTNALSHAVENSIDGIPNVDNTLRYQGIDRYETAVNIAGVTVGAYGIDSDADVWNVNAYITTGRNFPDALSAGAAAAENDGVVVLTDDVKMDRRGFTEQFLINLNDWVDDDGDDRNTNENFAVGGPSAKAVVDYDIRHVAAYVGANRYETATKTAQATFDDPEFMAIASGEGFADALVASGFIANADGPLLLTKNASLSSETAAYLEAEGRDLDGDTLIVFGGPGSVSLNVSAQVKALVEKILAPIVF